MELATGAAVHDVSTRNGLEAVHTRGAARFGLELAEVKKPKLREPQTADARLVEVQRIHSATLIQHAPQYARKQETMRNLKGFLFKRAADRPVFQKRNFCVKVRQRPVLFC